MANDLSSKISVRFTEKELYELGIKAKQERKSLQSIGHDLYLRWLTAAAPAEIEVTDAGGRESKLESYVQYILRAKPQELTELEQVFLTFSKEVLRLKELEEKRARLKEKNGDPQSSQA